MHVTAKDSQSFGPNVCLAAVVAAWREYNLALALNAGRWCHERAVRDARAVLEESLTDAATWVSLEGGDVVGATNGRYPAVLYTNDPWGVFAFSKGYKRA